MHSRGTSYYDTVTKNFIAYESFKSRYLRKQIKPIKYNTEKENSQGCCKEEKSLACE